MRMCVERNLHVDLTEKRAVPGVTGVLLHITYFEVFLALSSRRQVAWKASHPMEARCAE